MTTVDADGHRQLREALGAFVLGQLDPDTQEAVRVHLAGCPECRAELAGLQPVATALAGLRRHPVLGGPLPAGLGRRLDEALGREAAQRRRRGVVRAVTGLAAAAVLVVVAVLGFGALRESTPTAPVPTPIAVSVRDPAQVTADAGIIAHTWGVEVRMTSTGLTSGERFAAFVIEDDGRAVPAGTFVGVGDNRMVCNLQASVPATDASGFQIRDQAGQTVVSGSF